MRNIQDINIAQRLISRLHNSESIMLKPKFVARCYVDDDKNIYMTTDYGIKIYSPREYTIPIDCCQCAECAHKDDECAQSYDADTFHPCDNFTIEATN